MLSISSLPNQLDWPAGWIHLKADWVDLTEGSSSFVAFQYFCLFEPIQPRFWEVNSPLTYHTISLSNLIDFFFVGYQSLFICLQFLFVVGDLWRLTWCLSLNWFVFLTSNLFWAINFQEKFVARFQGKHLGSGLMPPSPTKFISVQVGFSNDESSELSCWTQFKLVPVQNWLQMPEELWWKLDRHCPDAVNQVLFQLNASSYF